MAEKSKRPVHKAAEKGFTPERLLMQKKGQEAHKEYSKKARVKRKLAKGKKVKVKFRPEKTKLEHSGIASIHSRKTALPVDVVYSYRAPDIIEPEPSIEVHGIARRRPRGAKIEPYEKEWPKVRGTFSPGEIKQVAKKFKKKYPAIRDIWGQRVTGATTTRKEPFQVFKFLRNKAKKKGGLLGLAGALATYRQAKDGK